MAGLFAWIDCRQQETDGTKAAEYRMLRQIYRLTRPGLSIPRASLSDASARRFYGLWAALARAPAHRQAVPFWLCWPATATPWPAGASHTRLHPELLAFYTCHMYFHYLAEFLLTHPLRDQSQAPADFFAPGQWLEERLRFADTVCP